MLPALLSHQTAGQLAPPVLAVARSSWAGGSSLFRRSYAAGAFPVALRHACMYGLHAARDGAGQLRLSQLVIRTHHAVPG
jgi:hypothetical protein